MSLMDRPMAISLEELIVDLENAVDDGFYDDWWNDNEDDDYDDHYWDREEDITERDTDMEENK